MILKFTSQLCGLSKLVRFQRFPSVRRFWISSSQCGKISSENTTYLDEVDHPTFGKLHTFYKFPYMGRINGTFTAKLLCIPVCLISSLVTMIAYMNDFATWEDIIASGYIQFIVVAQILAINKLFTNFVGFMYLTENKSIIISYINFWGQRIDEEFEKNELKLHYTDTGFLSYRNKFFVKLVCPSTKQQFKVHFKKAQMNEIVLADYFGPLPRSAF